ncbi:MAG: gamma-glutamyltransferase [Dethiosulfatibacter sp.]|nr:gamma-glutamyltransferase [Dethiosulfatibacter sp.]
MDFNCNYQPYTSNRNTHIAKNGMVATSQPLAANAGLDMLKKGGNAVDAAIATAACLTVVEPTSNGIGGDAFALVWIKNDEKLYGVNGSGFAPKGLSAEGLKDKGLEKMPVFGWTPVTVPGAPATWAALSKRFGKLPLSVVLEPAIRYAREGYPVTPTLGYYWDRGYKKYKAECSSEEYAEWYKTFTFNGSPPKVGQMVKLPNHANTLEEISKTDSESFYRGGLAEKIDACSRKYGGYLRKEDLAAYHVEWVEPIKVNYKGYEICEIPPNGQGIVAMMALNILKNFNFQAKETVDTYHKQFEAIKLAFADGKKYVTDPNYMKYKTEDLLSDAFADERRKQITDRAQDFKPGTPPSGGTVYLCTADAYGNMVSFIQSNYMGFGSGIVVDDTGIALQNRGADFSLDKDDYNYLIPGKKTYHTIIPGFILKDNQAVGPFGVMGGYMQPQGHLQVVMNLIDFNLNPQMALDAPRWQWIEGKKFMVEPNFPTYLVNALEVLGHEMTIATSTGSFGRGEMIISNGEVLFGATESRTDGSVACY